MTTYSLRQYFTTRKISTDIGLRAAMDMASHWSLRDLLNQPTEISFAWPNRPVNEVINGYYNWCVDREMKLSCTIEGTFDFLAEIENIAGFDCYFFAGFIFNEGAVGGFCADSFSVIGPRKKSLTLSRDEEWIRNHWVEILNKGAVFTLMITVKGSGSFLDALVEYKEGTGTKDLLPDAYQEIKIDSLPDNGNNDDNNE